MSDSEFIKIAQITSTHGVRGDVKLYLYTEFEDFNSYKNFYLGKDKQKISLKFKHRKKNLVIVSLSDIESVEEARKYQKTNIFIKKTDLAELDQDNFYQHQLVGLKVIDEKGIEQGEVIDLVNHGAGDNIIIKLKNKKTEEYPFLDQYFGEVDLKRRMIIMKDMEIL